MTQKTNPFFGPATKIAILVTLALCLLSCTSPAETEEDAFNPAGDSTLQASQPSQTLQGKVVSVLDGDTVILLDSNRETFKVRFKAIDAPEKSQPFGQQAKQKLSSLIFDRNVSVEWQERDRYQRILGKVEHDGQDIGLEMIKTGYAWHYKRFQQSQEPSDRISYAEAENKSRLQQIGLWQNPKPVPPWDYRSQPKPN